MFLTSRACEQRLLAVAHFDAQLLQLEQHRRLDDVEAQRHVADAFGVEQRLDLARRVAEQLDVGADRAAQAEQPRAAVVVMQPRRVQPMVLRRRAEIPDVRIAVAGEQRIARELVARPLADHRAGDVADVVLVEAQQRAQPRLGERGARAREAVVVQPAEIDALLEVDLRVAGRLQRPVPAVVRIDVVGPDDLRLRALAFPLRHAFRLGSSFSACTAFS